MDVLQEYLHNLWYMLLNFIGGFVTGFISFVIALGVLAFVYSTWNRFSIAYTAGAILGGISFICVLAGIPILFL